MRWFTYLEPNETSGASEIAISDAEILRVYYPWWCGQMTKVGKFDQISIEHCLEDFITIHWAWEIDNQATL